MTEQLASDAAALLANWRALPPREAGEELRDQDKQAILLLRREGKTQSEIAAVVGCDQATVSRTLSKLTDTRPLAEAIAHSSAAKMMQNVIDNGKPELHAKVLQGVGVKVLPEDESRGRSQVIVQIGVSGAPIPTENGARVVLDPARSYVLPEIAAGNNESA